MHAYLFTNALKGNAHSKTFHLLFYQCNTFILMSSYQPIDKNICLKNHLTHPWTIYIEKLVKNF